MRDHAKISKILSTKRTQLEHCLKYWQEGGNKKDPLQPTVDSLVMLADMNCVYDLLSSTFAEGHRVSELSLPQVLMVLRKV